MMSKSLLFVFFFLLFGGCASIPPPPNHKAILPTFHHAPILGRCSVGDGHVISCILISEEDWNAVLSELGGACATSGGSHEECTVIHIQE